MDEIKIYEFQLKAILEALNQSARILKSKSRETCIDRNIMQSIQYAENALNGKTDELVGRFGGNK